MTDARVALVTGGSSGIGEDAALRLRRVGFEVYASARRVDRMAGLAERGVHVLAMDVTDDASVRGGVERVLAEAGRLDVLVNNAGYGSYGAVEDVPIDEARRQFEVNLFGLARLTQLVTPQMREGFERLGRRGRIINISSMGAVYYEPFGAWYHATKFAVEGFSDSLRVELRPLGIDVVVIRPGAILTEWNEISRTSLRETSRGGAYQEMADHAARVMASADRRPLASPPAVVGRAIVRAATVDRPRSRYSVGRGAVLVPAARRITPDRVFDAILQRLYLRSSGRRPSRAT